MQLNERFEKAEYAVRGTVPTRAHAIKEQLKNPEEAAKYGFKRMIFCNIGNPQKLGQKPLTFSREVTALVVDPSLMDTHAELFSSDSLKRARDIQASDESIAYYGYTDVQGLRYVREQVCHFIENRDGFPEGYVDPDNIFLSNGASTAIKAVLAALSDMDHPETVGFMVPVPQYPLYSAAITCLGSMIVRYYLNEESGWSVDVDYLRSVYREETAKGVDIRAVIIINPGNPTGSVLSEECMMDVLDFCVENDVVLLADEVYQVNIYNEEKKFISFQKAAQIYAQKHSGAEAKVVSFHSASKGVQGECGQRGGYLCFSGFGEYSAPFREVLKEMLGPDRCPNLVGQCILSTMVAGPAAGSDTRSLYEEQRKDIEESLKRRAAMATETLNKPELGITCQVVEGALYAFPRIRLPCNFIAKDKTIPADTHYALKLVKENGLVVVPGSGFLQKEGTFHFRTSILPQEEDFRAFLDTLVKFQKEIWSKYGAGERPDV